MIANSQFDQALMIRSQPSGGGVALPTTDPDLWAWWSTDTTLPNNGSIVNGQWTDRSGAGRKFLAPNGGSEPGYSASGCNGHPIIQFQGTGFMRTDVVTLNQPVSIYMLLRIPSFQSAKVLLDGVGAFAFLQMNTPGTLIQCWAGAGYAADNSDMAFDNSWHVLTFILNGASSVLCVDSHSDTTGNPGSDNPGGITLGQFSGGGAFISTYDLGSLIVSAAANNSTIRAIHRTWLRSYGGI